LFPQQPIAPALAASAALLAAGKVFPV
jgi:hypothetical protein